VDYRVIEKDIITFVTQNLWDDLEKHLVKIIDIPEALDVHPVLFLHIRRSKLLYLLEMKRYDDATAYFTSDIKGPFDEVINLGQEKLTFASVRYMTAQIDFCSLCVTTKERYKVKGKKTFSNIKKHCQIFLSMILIKFLYYVVQS
jgi:hypothetical protein